MTSDPAPAQAHAAPDRSIGEPSRETHTPPGRVYYPELDGLRFFAFLAVYVFHYGVPELSGWIHAGLTWLRDVAPSLVPISGYITTGQAIRANGWIGVQLFFVLSGYLITSLLMREEARNGRVDVRAFWIRRILRIWPLYYLCVAIGFVAIPLYVNWSFGSSSYQEFLGRHFAGFCLFLANWSIALRGPAPFDELSILWTVSLEEQFYILCPLLFPFVPRKLRIPFVLGLMVFAITRRAHNVGLVHAHAMNPVHFQYSSLTQLDTLLAGVLLALLLPAAFRFDRPRWAGSLAQLAAVLAFAGLLIYPRLAQPGNTQQGLRDRWVVAWEFVLIYAVFAGLIAAVSRADGWLRTLLCHRWMTWLGKISYGLYMYHILGIRLGADLFGRIGWFPNKEILQTIFTFALTVTLAGLSYTYFERPFLRLKDRWTRVPSRPV